MAKLPVLPGGPTLESHKTEFQVPVQWDIFCWYPARSSVFRIAKIQKIRVNGMAVKHWESIVEKLKTSAWEVRWTEAMHDGEIGWTATAVRGKERHSSHANDITLAFQELESSCSQYPDRPAPRG